MTCNFTRELGANGNVRDVSAPYMWRLEAPDMLWGGTQVSTALGGGAIFTCSLPAPTAVTPSAMAAGEDR